MLGCLGAKAWVRTTEIRGLTNHSWERSVGFNITLTNCQTPATKVYWWIKSGIMKINKNPTKTASPPPFQAPPLSTTHLRGIQSQGATTARIGIIMHHRQVQGCAKTSRQQYSCSPSLGHSDASQSASLENRHSKGARSLLSEELRRTDCVRSYMSVKIFMFNNYPLDSESL